MTHSLIDEQRWLVSTHNKRERQRRARAVVGALVRKARRHAGISQRTLASWTGVDQGSICRCEREQETPSTETLLVLMQALGYTVTFTK